MSVRCITNRRRVLLMTKKAVPPPCIQGRYRLLHSINRHVSMRKNRNSGRVRLIHLNNTVHARWELYSGRESAQNPTRFIFPKKPFSGKFSLKRSHCKPGDEMENKQEEPQTNESRVKVKRTRCDSMGAPDTNFSLDPVKPESHTDVPKTVQDEKTEDIHFQR